MDLCSNRAQSPARGDTLRAILSPPIGAQKSARKDLFPPACADGKQTSPPAGSWIGIHERVFGRKHGTIPSPNRGEIPKPRQERQRRPGVGCTTDRKPQSGRNPAELGRSPLTDRARCAEQSKRRNCIARCPQTEREQREVNRAAQFRGDKSPARSHSRARSHRACVRSNAVFAFFVRAGVIVGKQAWSGISLDLQRLPPGGGNIESAGGPEFIDGNQVLVPHRISSRAPKDPCSRMLVCRRRPHPICAVQRAAVPPWTHISHSQFGTRSCRDRERVTQELSGTCERCLENKLESEQAT